MSVMFYCSTEISQLQGHAVTVYSKINITEFHIHVTPNKSSGAPNSLFLSFCSLWCLPLLIALLHQREEVLITSEQQLADCPSACDTVSSSVNRCGQTQMVREEWEMTAYDLGYDYLIN